MIDDIIFDWDGTLVDTLPFLKETFDKTFEHLGRKTMSYAEIRRVIHENQGVDLFHSVFGARDFFQAKRFFIPIRCAITFKICLRCRGLKIFSVFAAGRGSAATFSATSATAFCAVKFPVSAGKNISPESAAPEIAPKTSRHRRPVAHSGIMKRRPKIGFWLSVTVPQIPKRRDSGTVR